MKRRSREYLDGQEERQKKKKNLITGTKDSTDIKGIWQPTLQMIKKNCDFSIILTVLVYILLYILTNYYTGELIFAVCLMWHDNIYHLYRLKYYIFTVLFPYVLCNLNTRNNNQY